MALLFFYSRTHTTCVVSAASCNVENSNKQDGLACQCSIGYKGTITWNGATANGTCVKTRCTGIDNNTLQDVLVHKDKDDEHGSKATFTCNNGYVLIGNYSITCDAPREDAPWPKPPEPPRCGRLVDATLTVDSHFTRRMSPITNLTILN